MSAWLWDLGLQNERTTLAWQRTALGLLVTGVLAARAWLELAVAAGVSVVLVTLVLAGAVVVASRSRYVCAVGERPAPLTPSSSLMVALAGGTAVLGVTVLGELLRDLV